MMKKLFTSLSLLLAFLTVTAQAKESGQIELIGSDATIALKCSMSAMLFAGTLNGKAKFNPKKTSHCQLIGMVHNDCCNNPKAKAFIEGSFLKKHNLTADQVCTATNQVIKTCGSTPACVEGIFGHYVKLGKAGRKALARKSIDQWAPEHQETVQLCIADENFQAIDLQPFQTAFAEKIDIPLKIQSARRNK